MELCKDKTLQHWIAEYNADHANQKRFEEAKKILVQCLRALAYLHSHNCVHRDVKPSNLLFGQDEALRLADFGLAKWLEFSAASPRLPARHLTIGCTAGRRVAVGDTSREDLSLLVKMGQRPTRLCAAAFSDQSVQGDCPLGSEHSGGHLLVWCGKWLVFALRFLFAVLTFSIVTKGTWTTVNGEGHQAAPALPLQAHAAGTPPHGAKAPELTKRGASGSSCEWLCVRSSEKALELRVRLLPDDLVGGTDEFRAEELPEELTQKDEASTPRGASWTVEDISIWLQWLGIGEHVESFAARGVDGELLLQLSADANWAELGVHDVAQQRVLDSAVEPLRCFHHGALDATLALHAIEGPVAGQIFFVGAGVTGGRHNASNNIVLSENYVSRRHFQILRDRVGQYLLQDDTSVSELNGVEAFDLLQECARRVRYLPEHTTVYCAWIQRIVQHHGSFLRSQPVLADETRYFYDHARLRCAMYRHLLRIRGRLLHAVNEGQKVVASKDEVIKPLLEYVEGDEDLEEEASEEALRDSDNEDGDLEDRLGRGIDRGTFWPATDG
eukprot:g2656.t1